MLVETIHPITGKKKVVTMNQDEYEAMKILSPLTVRKMVNLHVNLSGSSLEIGVQTIPADWDHPRMMKEAAEIMRLQRVRDRMKKLKVTHVDIFTYDVEAHNIATNVPVDVLIHFK